MVSPVAAVSPVLKVAAVSLMSILKPLSRASPGRNIYRMAFRSGVQERNELFLPGRMAYVVDLDDEFTDTDIPTTLIRSKADCPSMEVRHVPIETLLSLCLPLCPHAVLLLSQAQTTLTTNDIVISKLTQILSYLRQGTRHKKMKKKDKGWTHLQPVSPGLVPFLTCLCFR